MAEETLRYRVEIDEASLQSELARSRGAITSVLQQAVSTGQYTLNSIQSDLAMTRQVLGNPASPVAFSMPASPLRELGFMGSMFALAGGPTPINMMSNEFQRMAALEMESRMTEATMAIGRQALPVGLGLAGSLGGMAMGLGAGPSLLMGGAGYLGGAVLADLAGRGMEIRAQAEEQLAITRAPNAMAPFSQAQRRELASNLAMDVAKDVRFGLEDLNPLLAGAQSMDMFTGVRSVEDFRARFKNMMEQVKTITRVFQQTNEEALQTLGAMNQMGLAAPGAVNGRIADVLTLSRMGGMPAGQALALGMSGAQMAGQQGVPLGVGFDMGMRNAIEAQAAAGTMMIDPATLRQMGGVGGVADLANRFGFAAARSPGLANLLAGFTNDSMTEIDQGRVRQFMSGALSLPDLQETAMMRLADPAQRVRYASNLDMLQNQLATSGLAGPLMMQMATVRGGMMGVDPNDMFMRMAGEMGLNPLERQTMLMMTQQQGRLEQVSSRSRQLAEFNIEQDRYREESRLTARIGSGLEQLRVGLSEAIGDPLRDLGGRGAGFFENLIQMPMRAFTSLDQTLGRAIFGGEAPPVRPIALGGFGDIQSIGDLERQGRYLRRATLGDLSEPISSRVSGGRNPTMQDIRIVSAQQATENLRDAVVSIEEKAGLDSLSISSRMSSDEKQMFQEAAIATFSDDLANLSNITDLTKRKEEKEKLKGKMSSWVRLRYGHLMDDEIEESDKFAGKLLKLEEAAGRDDNVRRGLEQAATSSAVLQMRQYVGDEIPALLAASAKSGNQEKLIGIGTQIAANFKGKPDLAAYHAMKELGARAIPLLGEGTALRERLEVGKMMTDRGFLRPGDMILDSKELATIREQNLTVGQEHFVQQLQQAAKDAEGQSLTADTVFRAIGLGLGKEMPSNTPSPGVTQDPYKWDMTARTLDQLTGSVNNLSMASKELVNAAKDITKRTAGKI